jgi:hypothetical protein
MRIKHASKQEILEKYKDNHGFAFVSRFRSSDSSLEGLANELIFRGIAKNSPLLIARYDKNDLYGAIFVFDVFNAPDFFVIATRIEYAFDFIEIIPFVKYLQ